LAKLSPSQWLELHYRLGHLNKEYITALLLSESVTNIVGLLSEIKSLPSSSTTSTIRDCPVCAASKITRKPIYRTENPATRPLGRIHTDTVPYPVITFGGYKYWQPIVDEYTRYGEVEDLKTKRDAAASLQDKVRLWERLLSKPGEPVKALYIRCDSGELKSTELQSWCRENGMLMQFSVPYVKEQNGLAERTVRTLKALCSTMMVPSNIPPLANNYAIKYASLLRNILILHPTLGRTPYELFHGKAFDLTKLQPFGCQVTVHLPKEIRPAGMKERWQSGVPGLFFGFASPSRPYVYTYHDRQVKPYFHVKFHPTRFPGLNPRNLPFTDPLGRALGPPTPQYQNADDQLWMNQPMEVEELELQGGISSDDDSNDSSSNGPLPRRRRLDSSDSDSETDSPTDDRSGNTLQGGTQSQPSGRNIQRPKVYPMSRKGKEPIRGPTHEDEDSSETDTDNISDAAEGDPDTIIADIPEDMVDDLQLLMWKPGEASTLKQTKSISLADIPGLNYQRAPALPETEADEWMFGAKVKGATNKIEF